MLTATFSSSYLSNGYSNVLLCASNNNNSSSSVVPCWFIAAAIRVLCVRWQKQTKGEFRPKKSNNDLELSHHTNTRDTQWEINSYNLECWVTFKHSFSCDIYMYVLCMYVLTEQFRCSVSTETHRLMSIFVGKPLTR